MDLNPTPEENYAHPNICFFHVLFKAGALAFYILSALFIDNFVIIFVVTVLLAALDFWVVKNVSGRILVGLRWWNEINDEGESVWKYECLDQESMARMNKKDSWLFWWTLYLTAVLWILFAIFSLIRFQADYLLVVGVCLTLSLANIIGFTRCRKDAKKQLQAFATQTIASRFQSTIQQHSPLFEGSCKWKMSRTTTSLWIMILTNTPLWRVSSAHALRDILPDAKNSCSTVCIFVRCIYMKKH